MSDKHNPTPWKIVEATKDERQHVADARGSRVFQFTDLDRANAEFIVASVSAQPQQAQDNSPEHIADLIPDGAFILDPNTVTNQPQRVVCMTFEQIKCLVAASQEKSE